MRQEEDEVKYIVLARSASRSTACPSALSDDIDEDDAVIRDYFNLGPDGTIPRRRCTMGGSGPALAPTVTLSTLAEQWASQDGRFASVSGYFPGARMLRQDPVECLFSFICSSNNHISR